jgi:hypothetical protein
MFYEVDASLNLRRMRPSVRCTDFISTLRRTEILSEWSYLMEKIRILVYETVLVALTGKTMKIFLLWAVITEITTFVVTYHEV